MNDTSHSDDIQIDYHDFVNAMFKNEYGLADLFEKLYADKLKFDHAKQAWYVFIPENNVWLEDKTELVRSFYANLLENMRVALNELSSVVNDKISAGDKNPPEKEIEKQFRRYVYMASCDRVTNSTIKLARHGCGKLSTDGQSWNRNPWLFPVQNGVIDLKTGEMKSGLADDMFNFRAICRYRGPTYIFDPWEKIISEIFLNDEEKIYYVQKCFGYAMTALTVEDVWWIWHGSASAGKSIILNGVQNVMSDFSCSIPSNNLMIQRNPPNIAGPRTDILALYGRRMARASETIEGNRLDDGKIKGIVSGERQVGRYPYSKNEISFYPYPKLFVDTNHPPRTSADDTGVWRRLVMVPFNARFVDDPQAPNEFKKNKHLKDIVLTEEYAEGILSWMVTGCLLWQLEGLTPPQSIINATRQYRINEDILLQFFQDMCELDDYSVTTVSEVNNRLETYCREMDGRRPPSAKKLHAWMKLNHGIESSKSNGQRIFRGLRLNG